MFTFECECEYTISLFISDASSSQCPSRLVNVKLLSHATVIDMTILALDKNYQGLQIQLFALVKVVILGVMSNIPDILLIFPLVSDVFNRTGIFKQATHHWVF
ncbi:hypothetical protein J3Q64DRAFT_1693418 [Phycomyces blakesleeanus]|uniref:Uncharacterized protein n=1 Tax=Phycomyces blakesleeanus TaxID=4837 RepID=A0ABR3BDR5_PHYBL